jgi:hypothetical protein
LGQQAGVLRILVWQEGKPTVKISAPLAGAQEGLSQLPDSARDRTKEKGVDVEQLLQAVLKRPQLRRLVEIQEAHSQVEITIE